MKARTVRTEFCLEGGRFGVWTKRRGACWPEGCWDFPLSNAGTHGAICEDFTLEQCRMQHFHPGVMHEVICDLQGHRNNH